MWTTLWTFKGKLIFFRVRLFLLGYGVGLPMGLDLTRIHETLSEPINIVSNIAIGLVYFSSLRELRKGKKRIQSQESWFMVFVLWFDNRSYGNFYSLEALKISKALIIWVQINKFIYVSFISLQTCSYIGIRVIRWSLCFKNWVFWCTKTWIFEWFSGNFSAKNVIWLVRSRWELSKEYFYEYFQVRMNFYDILKFSGKK